MPNVYVTNKSGHDVSAAKMFGDLIFLSKGKQPRYATNNIYREFLPILECSEPKDYILLTGLTVMNVIACSIFSLKHGKLNLLIHRPKNNDYIERTLYLDDVLSENINSILERIKGATNG